MKKLKAEVEKAVAFELSEANTNYPLFASRHAFMAVIKEEVWETKNELVRLDGQFNTFRYNVFTDEYEVLTEDVQLMQKHAINLACEAIQVAAMCDKWMLGRGDSNAEADDSLPAKLP